MKKQCVYLQFLLFATLLTSNAFAAPTGYNAISLSADASMSVKKDVMHAILYIELQDKNLESLSNKITEVNNEIISGLSQQQRISYATNSRRSYPIYDKNQKITSWQERIEIKLTGTDFDALGQFIAEQTNKWAVANVYFSLSNDKIQEIETSLIAVAIRNFKDKAKLIIENIGGSSYQILNMNVNTQVPHQAMYARSYMQESVDFKQFQVESGEEQISVQVTGSIELNMKWN